MRRSGPVAHRVGHAVLGALVAALVLAVSACTQPAPAPGPAPPPPTPVAEPTQLTVAVDEIGPGFNPHLLAHQSPVTTALATLVLPSVFRPDAEGVPRLDTTVATSAEVTSTDPFTVTYELNLEASWSSNAPIAAEDFVYLWDRMRSEPGTADTAGYRLVTDVRSRAAGKAVDVVFSEPYPQWRQLFRDLLPAHILKDAPGSWVGALTDGLPASGGPFRIAAVDRGRGDILLTRNDSYWDTPAVLDQILLRRLDTPAMTTALAAGDVDVALADAAPDVRGALRALVPEPRVQPAPRPVVTQLTLRADTGPLADVRARQAVGAILDREAVRAAAAPEALPADAFGPAPSEPGYAPTAPDGPPARPDPAAAGRLLTAAGWALGGDGRWRADGARVELVVAAAAEREQDLRAARAVAEQLEAAGIGASVVAPPAADLFGRPTVPATPPSPTPEPVSATGTGTPPTSAAPAAPGPAVPTEPAESTDPTPTESAPAPTTTTSPAPPTGADQAEVRVDLLVGPRTAGGDPASELASDYGCPAAGPVVTDAPAVPMGFCFPALRLVLEPLLTGGSDPQRLALAERVLWQQVPALPLYQPVTLVVSTAAADAATGIGPGPLVTGPLTGAQRWARAGG
ncbi:MAG TPA: ABC transporter family substrate-binding protein [Pseudonocardia sp.]|nr:ABC transporter family substrate-binding protein [Pseudonocardia sp.]